MLRVRDSALSSIASVRVRDGTGLATIATIRVRDGSGLSAVFGSSSSIQIEPPGAFGYASSDSNVYVTTDPVAVVGAPAGATIAWVSDNVAVTAVSPTSLSTIFRARCAPGITRTANVYANVNGSPTAPIVVELQNGGIAS